ncbi:MAG: hypothetical protein KKA79_06465 [Nanoarchaeota archaeon]|nr:hypothetical protein [Nanoarchaeota archaeon]
MEVNIYNLRGSDVGRTVTITGGVKKVEVPILKIQNAAFKCIRCGSIIKELQEGKKLCTPFACYKEQGGCGKSQASTKFQLLEKESKFIDTQKIEIEQSSIEIHSPRIIAILTNELVGNVSSETESMYKFEGVIRVGKDKASSRIFPFYLEVTNVAPFSMPEPTIDIDSITPSLIHKRQSIIEIIKKLSHEHAEGITIEDIMTHLKQQGVERDYIEKLIVNLKRDGKIYERKNGTMSSC